MISTEALVGIIGIFVTLELATIGGMWIFAEKVLTFWRKELQSLHDKVDDVNKTVTKVEREYMDKQTCREYRESNSPRLTVNKLERLCDTRV